MGEAKVGEAFIKHEFDEAIAIQQCIVDAETTLATSPPGRQREARDQGGADRRQEIPPAAQDARQGA